MESKVFNAGCDKFDEVAEELAGKVGETINTVFDNRVESATKAIQEAISICENLIEEEEKQKRKLSAEYETYKIQRSEKQQKLSQTQGEFEKLLNRID